MNLWKRLTAAIDDYIQSWHEAAAQTRRTNAEIDTLWRQAFGLEAVETAALPAPANGAGDRGKAKAKGGR